MSYLIVHCYYNLASGVRILKYVFNIQTMDSLQSILKDIFRGVAYFHARQLIYQDI